MNPAKIQILGNYWDCQIYRGRLYLFTINGAVKTVNWNALIESIQTEEYTNIAISYAFKNGRNLYHSELHELFRDEEIKNLLQNKFDSLSHRELIITEQQLNEFLIGEQETPFEELHVDSEVFSNRIFVLSHNSLLSTSIHGRGKKYPVTRKIQKHYDLYGFSMRANRYARLALSAGDDGLMEYNSATSTNLLLSDDRRMLKVSNNHSSFADYSFLSIYNSSLTGNSFMSYFTWDDKLTRAKPERIIKEEYGENQIFEGNNSDHSYLSWGANEKIYRAVNGGLEVVRFNNYAKPGEAIFSNKKFIPLQSWKGKVLSAYIAYFGTVLHCEYAVVVMLSDGSYYNIAGQVTRVRIFPRSLNYENHLHVIQDDKVEIYSFNNDYFVDQKEKDFGVAFRMPKTFGFVRGGYASRYESDEDYYNIDKDIIDSKKTDDKSTNLDDLPFRNS